MPFEISPDVLLAAHTDGTSSATVVRSEPEETEKGDNAMAERKELFTVQEVAMYLRVNEATVRRWIKNGTLEAVMLPHRGKREVFRIRLSTLQSILPYLDAAYS